MEYDIFKHGVTQSLITKFRNCPVATRLYLKGFASGDGMSMPLQFGNDFHDVMEAILPSSSENPYIDVVNSVPSFVNDQEAKPERMETYDSASADNMQMMETSLAMLEPVVKAFFNFHEDLFYGEEGYKIYMDDQGAFLEREFCIDVGAGIPARGKIDGLCEDGNGDLWLLEHKTKSQINEDALLMTVPRDMQVNLYMEAVRQITGKRPKGVLYNVVRRPGLRRKKSETLTDFVNRIKEDIAERPAHYFKMFLVSITEAEHEYQVELINNEMIRFRLWFMKEENLDPQHTHECVGVYGQCPFIKYCNSGKNELELENLVKRPRLFSELDGVQ